MTASRLPDRLTELRSRRFVKVAAWYLVAAWAVIQVATATFPYLGVPAWLITSIIVVAIVGFPIAITIAWLQERSTPRAISTGKRRSRSLTTAAVIIFILAGFTVWRLNARRTSSSDNVLASTTLAQVTSSPEVEEFPAVSPDARTLVFSREAAGFKQLFTRDLSTGEETQLTRHSADHIHASFSPDGRALLYVRAPDEEPHLDAGDVFGSYTGGDVWRMELATGRTQKIINSAYNPVFAPDGQHIAYDASFGGARRIWVADAVGRNPRQITTDASEAVQHIMPRWSPDGSRLVFQNNEKNKLDVRVVDVATGRITNLTDDLVRDVDPVWLPDGKHVVFSSPRGGGWNLWQVRVHADGTAGKPQQITTGAGQDLQAAPSPDGKSVVFVTLNQNSDIWLLPVNPTTGAVSGEATRLIATTREDSRPAWSPNGKQIAFNSDRIGDMNLYVYSLADRKTRQLTRGPGGDYQASWSPDGKRLVFFSSRSGSADIWTVDVERGALQQLTRDSALDVNPVYSPDGRHIAYQSDLGGHKEIWVMDADGKNARQLTTTGVGDHFMIFSDDGRTIYYVQTSSVMQVNVETGESKEVLQATKGSAHMSLSPDRTRFMDVLAHKTLWATPLSGAPPQEVFTFPDPDVRIDYPRWSPDGRFVAFDRLQPTGGDVWTLKLAR